MRTALVALCVLALANAAFAQKATYVAANIVPSFDKCPVKTPAVWDPKVFDSSLDSLTALTEFTDSLSKKCQESLLNLANCASDNDAFANPPSTITSLSTSNGCCLTDCSNSIKETIKLGCFNDLLKAICGNPKAEKYQTGLFNAGVRCANFDAACPAGGAAAPAKNATTASGAANVTAAAKPAAGNGTAATKDAAPAPAAESPAPAAKAAAPKNNAGTAAASAAAVMVGAAAILVL